MVIPGFDEADALPALHQRLAQALRGTGASWEIIYVDDGSADGTSWGELVDGFLAGPDPSSH